MFENDGGTAGEVDYIHYGASIGKDGFTFAVEKNDIEGGSADNVRFVASYGIDFEL
jgi:UDP-3-O-[3-hydroxymyristoyl] glucosamine N-acyltransferase